MCSLKTKHRLHNTNRIIIAGLTMIGLLMDGYQVSDAVFQCSVLIWVWLPECDWCVEAVVDNFIGGSLLMKTKFNSIIRPKN